MGPLEEELFRELRDRDHLVRVIVRLVASMLLGGLLGLERQAVGKAAGLRTHMLVALGATLFVLIPMEAGANTDGLSRVIQGLVAGIGFLGAGAILKIDEAGQIKGLTTAAGIWLTAAVGMAVGAGWIWPAIFGTLLAFAILRLVGFLEVLFDRRERS